ncbi:PREDICTED: alpha-L-arabinofuranosidase 1-like isoform X3 [Populus euphratica]|uniref:Alpha-L-arabinofuranosidase 1-like isoform X3 n=1 Tax=Populus euphratica TaxID=75702 RepID=A0AAJ6TQT1_POPEU|nr:PREDICTED: alpha-L-arabinofuranosidase 1-like isoform X3 [Populus euphratica]
MCFFLPGNYLKFYDAKRSASPDIKIIPNCDGSSHSLDHPADYYDFHVFTSASNLFSMTHKFDRTSCTCPKASVSDYAVTGNDVGTGSLLAALADAGFLIGLKRNRWNPDAIVFNSSKHYGTPSYWVQKFFRESSGATLPDAKLQTNSSTLFASAITWQNSNLPENKGGASPNYAREC